MTSATKQLRLVDRSTKTKVFRTKHFPDGINDDVGKARMRKFARNPFRVPGFVEQLDDETETFGPND